MDGRRGAAVAFEVSGAAAGSTTAVDALAVRGRLVMVAIHRAARGQPAPFLLARADLLGARLYQREDFEAAVALVADGQIPASALITRIEPLDAARRRPSRPWRPAAGVMKVLIDCQAEQGAGVAH